MFQQKWGWRAMYLFIAASPAFLGAILVVTDAVFTPGECRNMGGVVCYSHLVLEFGWIYSIPWALAAWLAVTALQARVLRKAKK